MSDEDYLDRELRTRREQDAELKENTCSWCGMVCECAVGWNQHGILGSDCTCGMVREDD